MADFHKHTVIDLFAGCGGLSLGLYLAGWKGLFAIEKNAFAFETLRYNLIDNKKHFNWPDWYKKKEIYHKWQISQTGSVLLYTNK